MIELSSCQVQVLNTGHLTLSLSPELPQAKVFGQGDPSEMQHYNVHEEERLDMRKGVSGAPRGLENLQAFLQLSSASCCILRPTIISSVYQRQQKTQKEPQAYRSLIDCSTKFCQQ